MMFKNILKNRLIACALTIFLASAGACICLFMGGLVYTLIGILLCAADIATAAIAVVIILGSFDEIGMIYSSNADFAVISINRRRKKAYTSDNFFSVTGVSTDERMTSAEADLLLAGLKAEPFKTETDIFCSPQAEKWYRITRIASMKDEIYALRDVSELISCQNVIYSLQAYDSATGIFKHEAFVTALRDALSAEKAEYDSIMLVHFVLSGMDKLISFSGSYAADEAVCCFANQLKKLDAERGVTCGRTATYSFSLLTANSSEIESPAAAESYISSLCGTLSAALNSLPDSTRSYIRVYCGYSLANRFDTTPEQLMSEADFASYDAEVSGSPAPITFNPESYERLSKDFLKIQVFTSIISRDLIDYHFQPIVNAHTGAIYGYEALMRPRETDGIKLSPLEMLEIAERQDMLYEIERITLNKSLRVLSENQDFFSRRKLFINCIPNSLLSESDYNNIFESFGALFDKVVVEITEGSQVLDSAIACLNRRFRSHNAQIALDDYGTGYSNDSTMLSVKPDYIKIDRSLLTDIDSDPQKQHLVGNIIGFASQHGIMSLAEGIETEAELKTVIALGAELIQGYYTCKATPILMLDLPVEIRSSIVDINLKQTGHIRKVFDVNGKDTIDIVNIALLGYTEIAIHSEKAVIRGNLETSVDVQIIIDSGIHSYVTLENLSVSGKDGPVIAVGQDSTVSFELVGSNNFYYEGIRVPAGSSAFFCGAGSLNIDCTHNNPVGIGGSYIQDYGNITIDIEGGISITGKGDSLVGIGGGISSANNSIQLISGCFSFKLRGIDVVGIGSYSGDTSIKINPVSISMAVGAQKAVGIGSINGRLRAECAAALDCDISGDTCCGIGTLENGTANISISSRALSKIFMHAKNTSAIGAVNGTTDCVINTGIIDILCEGDTVVGIGDSFGSGNIRINEAALRIISKASKDNTIYLKTGRVYIFGGNILTGNLNPIECYSPDGTELIRYNVSGAAPFKSTIQCSIGAYVYSAPLMPDTDEMCIYLPDGFVNERCTPNIKNDYIF